MTLRAKTNPRRAPLLLLLHSTRIQLASIQLTQKLHSYPLTAQYVRPSSLSTHHPPLHARRRCTRSPLHLHPRAPSLHRYIHHYWIPCCWSCYHRVQERGSEDGDAQAGARASLPLRGLADSSSPHRWEAGNTSLVSRTLRSSLDWRESAPSRTAS